MPRGGDENDALTAVRHFRNTRASVGAPNRAYTASTNRCDDAAPGQITAKTRFETAEALRRP